jgi:hypothetical protein
MPVNIEIENGMESIQRVVRFKVAVSVAAKITILWDVRPCR